MHERVYVGGRLEGYVNTSDDRRAEVRALSRRLLGSMEQRYIIVGEFVVPAVGCERSASRCRTTCRCCGRSSSRGRLAAGSRSRRGRRGCASSSGSGPASCVLPQPPFPGATPLARLDAVEQMQLYDCDPRRAAHLRRPRRADGAGRRVADPGDVPGRASIPRTACWSASRRRRRPACPAPPVPASATFVEDGLNRVVIRAGTAGDGYLALLDTYIPDWKVTWTAPPAPLMRANGLFRAVHLTRGRTHRDVHLPASRSVHRRRPSPALTCCCCSPGACSSGGAALVRVVPSRARFAAAWPGSSVSSRCRWRRSPASSPPIASSSSATSRSSSGRAISGCARRSRAGKRRGGIRTSRAGSRRSPTR